MLDSTPHTIDGTVRIPKRPTAVNEEAALLPGTWPRGEWPRCSSPYAEEKPSSSRREIGGAGSAGRVLVTERAREAFGILATGERRFYGNLIVRKGVIPPEVTRPGDR